MKKYLSLIIAGIAALLAVSCTQDELVMFDASKATAPVLQSYVVTDDDVTVDFTPGSFGQSFNTKMAVNHSIILKTVNGEAVGNTVPSALKDGKLVVTVTNLSKALIALGYEEGQKVALEMVIRASMQEVARDNGVNGFVESVGVINIPDYEVFLPTGDPYARYTEKSEWGLVGSFNGWGSDPDVEMWTNGTLHVAKGVQLSAGTEVKFRKNSDWAENFGYASEGQTYTLGEEFPLSAGGPNIVILADGRYDLILDPVNGTAKIIDSVADAVDPYAAYTEKSEWGLVGSFSGWGSDPDVEMWTNGTLHVAKNVTLAAGTEVKFRKNSDWTDNFGYATEGQTYTLGEEFDLSAGGPNIVILEDGAYDLFLDPENAKGRIIKTAVVVVDPYASYKEVSPWSVIGSFNSWGGDVEMVTNGTLHVAKAVAFTAGTEWKFRKDADWAVNFGYVKGSGTQYVLGEEFEVAQDGDNIVVLEDGVYDLILDPENATAKIIASVAVEQPEPPTPEEKPKAWSLIGTLNGTGWDTDFDLTNTSGDIWLIRSVKVTASDEFKIRADHDWAKSVGGPEENSQSTIDETNPYGVYKPEIGKAFEAKDKNIQIGVEGTYDITFDYAAMTILIEEHVSGYSLIGNIEGTEWNKDFMMKEKDGVWTSDVVKINGGFKVRYDYSWADENTYGMAEGAEPQVGTAFTLVQPGSDIKLAEGSYKVQFTPATKEILITAVNYPEHLYMIGEEFGGWNWDSDGVVEMVPAVHHLDWGADGEGQFWTVRYFSAGKGFKFCAQRAWNGDFWGLETNEGFTESSGNCTVAEDGFYMVHIDMKRGIVHVEPARIYGIGSCFGGWNEGMEDALFVADGKTLKATTADEGELRMYAASAIANETSGWWTREFVILDGKIDYRGDDEGQGDQQRVKVLKGQVVTLDFNAGTGTITGEGEVPDKPTAWSLIGTLDGSSWDKDFDLENTSGDLWVIKKVAVTASDEFKIRANHDWAKSVGGPEANDHSIIDETNPYDVYKPEIGKAFEAGDKNIRIGVEGTYTVTFDYKANTILIEEYKEFPNALYMIGQDFGSWDWGSDGVVELVPVLHNPDWGADAPGQFWTIRYFKADSGFKFNSAKAWDGGQFGKLETNDGFTNDGDENLHVPEDGVYMVHVDLKRGMLHVEKARVSGKGDCFGGWEASPVAFTEKDGKLTVTTSGKGEIRMYAESSIATSDWWTREFVFFDGKIAYRGNGGDQERVVVEADKTITLDFNAGTAVVE